MTGIFCAIDTARLEEAEKLVRALSGLPLHIKLGLEFFVAEGPQGVQKIRAKMAEEVKLFLDLKLHDIPHTVAGAVRAAVKCGADFLTLHAAGGGEMMRAAQEAAAEEAVLRGQAPPQLLAVTVLTHLAHKEAQSEVLRLAEEARTAGLSGLVCSPLEIAPLRRRFGADLLLVTPGIRPEGTEKGDQRRIMTPAQAAAAGADYLVIGRPITQSPDPAAAAQGILATLNPLAA